MEGESEVIVKVGDREGQSALKRQLDIERDSQREKEGESEEIVKVRYIQGYSALKSQSDIERDRERERGRE